ncbi:MAG: hypothetical protein AAF298_17580 [Cyanobacteria bacterium P01_A01_bin.40]
MYISKLRSQQYCISEFIEQAIAKYSIYYSATKFSCVFQVFFL